MSVGIHSLTQEHTDLFFWFTSFAIIHCSSLQVTFQIFLTVLVFWCAADLVHRCWLHVVASHVSLLALFVSHSHNATQFFHEIYHLQNIYRDAFSLLISLDSMANVISWCCNQQMTPNCAWRRVTRYTYTDSYQIYPLVCHYSNDLPIHYRKRN